MRSQDRQTIENWQQKHNPSLELTLIKTGDARTGELLKFLEALVELVPSISFRQRSGEDEALPAIQLCENIFYHAIPEGPELKPFLTVMAYLSETGTPPFPPMMRALKNMDMPAELNVYIAPQCPFCPVQVERLMPFAFASSMVHIHVIDGVLFSDVSEKYNIQSAPTVILDKTFTWTGQTPVQEILTIILDRDPSKMGPSTLEGMLKAGDAFKLAEMMLAKHMIFPALIELMVTGKWPVRLGAMVAIETIAEENIDLAGEIVAPLMARMAEMDAKAKGDMAYVAGICGDDRILPTLEAIRMDAETDAELEEAVLEAIESIQARSGQ